MKTDTLLRRLILAILAIWYLCSCSSSYWEDSKRTSSGKHTYYRQGWPQNTVCATYNTLPMKVMTFKRYSYWRHK